MQVLGVQDNAYWASWTVTGIVINIVMSLEMIWIGKLNGFDVFVKSPWWVIFGLLFLIISAFMSLAFLLSTLVNTKTQAFTINFCVVLASMVLNIVLSEPTIIKKVFYNLDQPDWVMQMTKVFYLFPSFMFGKMFSDITYVTSFRFDAENVMWIKSERDFIWDDMFYHQEGVFFSKDRFR